MAAEHAGRVHTEGDGDHLFRLYDQLFQSWQGKSRPILPRKRTQGSGSFKLTPAAAAASLIRYALINLGSPVDRHP